jgi:hypothetical protein
VRDFKVVENVVVIPSIRSVILAPLQLGAALRADRTRWFEGDRVNHLSARAGAREYDARDRQRGEQRGSTRAIQPLSTPIVMMQHRFATSFHIPLMRELVGQRAQRSTRLRTA